MAHGVSNSRSILLSDSHCKCRCDWIGGRNIFRIIQRCHGTGISAGAGTRNPDRISSTTSDDHGQLGNVVIDRGTWSHTHETGSAKRINWKSAAPFERIDFHDRRRKLAECRPNSPSEPFCPATRDDTGYRKCKCGDGSAKSQGGSASRFLYGNNHDHSTYWVDERCEGSGEPDGNPGESFAAEWDDSHSDYDSEWGIAVGRACSSGRDRDDFRAELWTSSSGSSRWSSGAIRWDISKSLVCFGDTD